jgi:hypothetical protein
MTSDFIPRPSMFHWIITTRGGMSAPKTAVTGRDGNSGSVASGQPSWPLNPTNTSCFAKSAFDACRAATAAVCVPATTATTVAEFAETTRSPAKALYRHPHPPMPSSRPKQKQNENAAASALRHLCMLKWSTRHPANQSIHAPKSHNIVLRRPGNRHAEGTSVVLATADGK